MKSNRFYSERGEIPPVPKPKFTEKRQVVINGVVRLVDSSPDDFLSHVSAKDFNLSAAVESGSLNLLRDLGSVSPERLNAADTVTDFSVSTSNIEENE